MQIDRLPCKNEWLVPQKFLLIHLHGVFPGKLIHSPGEMQKPDVKVAISADAISIGIVQQW